MRKTLEITALVITIVAGVVAIIVFLSGRNSLSAFVSTSPAPTSTTVSVSSSLTPTTSTSSASSVEADPFVALFYGQGPVHGIALILMIVLAIISFIVAAPRKPFPVFMGCNNMIMATFGWLSMLFVPLIMSYVIYELLGMVVTVPLTLVLLTNIIVYPICLFIVYIFKKWIISFE